MDNKRHGEVLALGMRSCHGGKQVRRKRRNAALARQVVADKRDLANFGNFFHGAVFHSSRPALLCTRVCAPTTNVPTQREVGRNVFRQCRFRPSGGDFKACGLPIRCGLAGAREGYSRRPSDRPDKPTKLSLSMIASLQSPLLSDLAKSLYLASWLEE